MIMCSCMRMCIFVVKDDNTYPERPSRSAPQHLKRSKSQWSSGLLGGRACGYASLDLPKDDFDLSFKNYVPMIIFMHIWTFSNTLYILSSNIELFFILSLNAMLITIAWVYCLLLTVLLLRYKKLSSKHGLIYCYIATCSISFFIHDSKKIWLLYSWRQELKDLKLLEFYNLWGGWGSKKEF